MGRSTSDKKNRWKKLERIREKILDGKIVVDETKKPENAKEKTERDVFEKIVSEDEEQTRESLFINGVISKMNEGDRVAATYYESYVRKEANKSQRRRDEEDASEKDSDCRLRLEGEDYRRYLEVRKKKAKREERLARCLQSVEQAKRLKTLNQKCECCFLGGTPVEMFAFEFNLSLKRAKETYRLCFEKLSKEESDERI